MYFIISILFIFCGILAVIKPIYFINFINTFRNNNTIEPSNLYILSTRFGGFMFVIVGAIYLISIFAL